MITQENRRKLPIRSEQYYRLNQEDREDLLLGAVDKKVNKNKNTLQKIQKIQDEIKLQLNTFKESIFKAIGGLESLESIQVELNCAEFSNVIQHTVNECAKCLEKDKIFLEKEKEYNAIINSTQKKINELESKDKKLQEKFLKLEASNQALLKEISIDDLTGLGNRKGFNKDIKSRIESGIDFSIAVIDLDHFKNVNDTYGHSTGDQVLSYLAKKLKLIGGSAYRWGGEEFIIIHNGEESDLKEKIEQLKRGSLRNPFKTREYQDAQIYITFSAGIMKYKYGMSITDFTKKADAIMYEAKKTRDTLITFEEMEGKSNTIANNSSNVTEGIN